MYKMPDETVSARIPNGECSFANHITIAHDLIAHFAHRSSQNIEHEVRETDRFASDRLQLRLLPNLEHENAYNRVSLRRA